MNSLKIKSLKMLGGSIIFLLPLKLFAQNNLPSLEYLNSRIKADQPSDVVEILKPREYDFAGDAQYDMLFSRALMFQHEYERASFVLERVVATNPNNIEAQRLLATAYLNLGQFDSAINAVEAAKQIAKTAADKESVKNLQEKIKDDIYYWPGRTKIEGAIEGGGGWTNNATYGPNNPSFFVPTAESDNKVFTLDTDGTKQGDYFYRASGLLNITHFISPHFYGGGHAGVDAYENFRKGDSADFVQQNAGLELGTIFKYFSLTLNGNYLDYAIFHTSYVKSLEYRAALSWTPNPQWVSSIIWQKDLYHYQFSDQYFWDNSSDYDRQSIGLYNATVWGKGQVASLYLYAAREDAKHMRQDGDSTAYGLTANYKYPFTQKIYAYLSGGYYQQKFKTVNTNFLVKRKSNVVNGSGGVSVNISDKWSIVPEVSYVSDNSNIPFRKYSRMEYYLRLRWNDSTSF